MRCFLLGTDQLLPDEQAWFTFDGNSSWYKPVLTGCELSSPP